MSTKNDEELLEKEWIRMNSDTGSVIMSEDLIARVHPYNVDVNEISGVGISEDPICSFEFSDYTFTGKMVSYSNNPRQKPIGESMSVSYTVSASAAQACKLLIESSLKSYFITISGDEILKNDLSGCDIPADVHINWVTQDEVLITLTLDVTPTLD
jgi:hypothetical protein